jgi:hypothetical protein
MCCVSYVAKYGQEQLWPNPLAPNPWIYPAPTAVPFTPAPPGGILPTFPFPYVPPVDPSKLLIDMKEYSELIEKARKLDELLGQPDCPDPEKEAWIAKLEERIRRLEAADAQREFNERF